MIALRSICTIIALGTIAGVGAAQAADLPRRTEPYVGGPAYAPAPKWTGAYVGVHAGGGFGKAGSVSTNGLVGGVHGGYNAQFDKVVVGGEVDVTASGVENKGFTEKVSQTWLGSARARLGYTLDPSLLAYGTAGLALGNTTGQSVAGKNTDTKSGFVLGVGGEYLVNPNVAVRAEYLYYDLGKSNFPTTTGPVKIDYSTNVLRAGASYKF
jgi:outer membrane immunogenic protein